jgi:hypothetical protein
LPDQPPIDPREMHEDIATLMGGIAKAFDLDESTVISAVEQGEIAMTLDTDSNGNRFVSARFRGEVARLYAGAVYRETETNH